MRDTFESLRREKIIERLEKTRENKGKIMIIIIINK